MALLLGVWREERGQMSLGRAGGRGCRALTRRRLCAGDQGGWVDGRDLWKRKAEDVLKKGVPSPGGLTQGSCPLPAQPGAAPLFSAPGWDLPCMGPSSPGHFAEGLWVCLELGRALGMKYRGKNHPQTWCRGDLVDHLWGACSERQQTG